MNVTLPIFLSIVLSQVGVNGRTQVVPRSARQAAPIDTEADDAPPARRSVPTQGDDAETTVPARRSQPRTTVDQIQPTQQAAQIIAEALATPKDGALTGEPMTLQQAISKSNDRQKQIKIVQGYWRLAMNQAEYFFARQQRIRFQQFSKNQLWLDPATKRQPNAGVYAARNVFRAVVRDCEVDVLRAQHALAELLGQDASKPLPLVVDAPHVKQFRTELQTVFANRTPPARYVLIDEMLKLRYNTIDAHTRAIITADDAVEATAEEYRAGQTDLTTLLATLDELWRQHHGFLFTVRDYNQDFAEYALGTAPAGVSAANLVSRLIIPKASATNRSRTFTEEDDGTSGARVPAGARPKRSILREPGDEEGAAVRPVESDPASNSRFQQVSFMQTRRSLSADNLDRGLYADLLGSEKFKRGARVGGLLNQRRVALSAGQPVTLARCLEGVPADRREAVIEAYWNANERLARYQLFSEEIEILNSLVAWTARLRGEPGGSGAMLRLQAGKAGAQADVAAELVDLYEAQFELTTAAGRQIGAKLLVPSTPPHAGRYDLRLEEQTSSRLRTRTVQSAVDLIPVLHAELCDRSGSIVHLDAARITAVSARNLDIWAINAALDSTHRQTNEALSYLDSQTRYNTAIAIYALAVMPSGVAADRLVGALVVSSQPTVGPGA